MANQTDQAYVVRPPSHPVAPDVDKLVAEAKMVSDPEEAVKQLINEKKQLTNALTQERAGNDQLRQENSALTARMKQFEPYEDILKDSRAFLPIYIRDRILIKSLQVKARQRWGKVADINSASESGRKMAHRHIDHMVEVALRHDLKIWHQIKPQLEEEAHANKV